MIIQSLVALYERLAESQDPDLRLPEPGWQEREIAFVIELGPAGQPVNVVPLRQAQPKGRARAPLRLVPQEVKRTGKIPDQATEKDSGKASLFWDNPRYALGLPAGDDTKSARDADVCHGLFKLRHLQFARDAGADVANDAGMRAVLRFLDQGAASALKALAPDQFREIAASAGTWRSGCTATWT